MNRNLIALLAAAGLGLGYAAAGTLVGTVTARPKVEPVAEPGGGKYESRRYKFVEKIDYDALKEFVVFIDKVATNAAPPAKPVQIVTQRDAVFRPHVLPLLVGTTVEWPNKDDIFHNVFSVSEAKEFDLGLYKGEEVKKVTFDKPGRVDVFCSIHKKMNCVILVLRNPWFAATDDKGRYRITGVPAGTYQVKAWHEFLPAQTKEITVPAEGEVKVDFTVGVNNLPKN